MAQFGTQNCQLVGQFLEKYQPLITENLCKTATLKKTKNWFSGPLIG